MAAHPRNFVRLELPESQSSDDAPLARYERAASEFKVWRDEGVLRSETAPALYPYRQRFTTGGERCERRGFIAALRLEPWESRGVRPHEKTLSGPKQDRLRLIQACHANFSPIWVLYHDGAGATERFWDAIDSTEPEVTAVDRDGFEHALWAMTDAAGYRSVLGSLIGGSVYIADGHHRYETALHYQAERRGESGWTSDSAANFTMAYFVEMSDPGLIINGTHRVINPPAPITANEVRSVLDRWFDFAPGGDSPASVLTALQAAPRRPGFGVWAPALGLTGVAILRTDSVPESHAAGRSSAWRHLDLAALHALAVDQIFTQGTAALNETGNLWYTRDLIDVDQAVSAGTASLCFIVRETPAEQVIAVADASDLMPEKSTYFYPKPLSGMVIASVDGEISPLT
jgi:uncharacterized protein (DUF1015 family)